MKRARLSRQAIQDNISFRETYASFAAHMQPRKKANFNKHGERIRDEKCKCTHVRCVDGSTMARLGNLGRVSEYGGFLATV